MDLILDITEQGSHHVLNCIERFEFMLSHDSKVRPLPLHSGLVGFGVSRNSITQRGQRLCRQVPQLAKRTELQCLCIKGYPDHTTTWLSCQINIHIYIARA